MKNVLGLDLSLNGSGIVLLSPNNEILHHEVVILNTNKRNKLKGMDRILYIIERINKLVTEYRDLHVIIEGYSFGSKGRSVVSLGELGGAVRLFLFQNNIPFLEVPPTTLKKVVTGRGDAKKEDMLAAVRAQLGVSFDDHNVNDAFCLARYREQIISSLPPSLREFQKREG